MNVWMNVCVNVCMDGDEPLAPRPLVACTIVFAPACVRVLARKLKWIKNWNFELYVGIHFPRRSNAYFGERQILYGVKGEFLFSKSVKGIFVKTYLRIIRWNLFWFKMMVWESSKVIFVPVGV